MPEYRIKEWLNKQVELQKISAIHFTGKHNVLEPDSFATKEVVDFDFHAEMSGFADLEKIEIRRSNSAETAFVTTAEDENEMAQQAIEHLESIFALGYDKITFDNVFVNYDGMLARLQTWAKLSCYGGRVAFNNVNVSGALTSKSLAASDEPRISIQAVWRYKWERPEARPSPRHVLQSPPNTWTDPRPMTWNWRIQHAMVDGEYGVISLSDDTGGPAPMIKAIAKYALHEPLTMQGNFGTCKIHKWGLDEPNDEPAYAGTRHFGRARTGELPPPYAG
ncbi:hypothetical protein QM012_005070 [Aureobasidium pullulans]|uniref:Uncharacterized protein n=1 Tax=Aureobasidium pullulans TaxID=5580 RepID=A0ABR0T6N8_AURPU